MNKRVYKFMKLEFAACHKITEMSINFIAFLPVLVIHTQSLVDYSYPIMWMMIINFGIKEGTFWTCPQNEFRLPVITLRDMQFVPVIHCGGVGETVFPPIPTCPCIKFNQSRQLPQLTCVHASKQHSDMWPFIFYVHAWHSAVISATAASTI